MEIPVTEENTNNTTTTDDSVQSPPEHLRSADGNNYGLPDNAGAGAASTDAAEGYAEQGPKVETPAVQDLRSAADTLKTAIAVVADNFEGVQLAEAGRISSEIEARVEQLVGLAA